MLPSQAAVVQDLSAKTAAAIPASRSSALARKAHAQNAVVVLSRALLAPLPVRVTRQQRSTQSGERAECAAVPPVSSAGNVSDPSILALTINPLAVAWTYAPVRCLVPLFQQRQHA
jgi:hypothetical protein